MSSVQANDPAPRISVLAVPSADWDEYVDRFSDASVYFHRGWALLARDVFGHRPFFLEARDTTGTLVGVLPLVQQRSLLGNFATSIPFFNYGGVLSDSEVVRTCLMERARVLGGKRGCSYVELRDVDARSAGWRTRTDKVTMVLQLPPDTATLGKQLGSKLRSQVKRSDRESPSVRVGAGELLDDFYRVFAENMRDLGTPVYPKVFFQHIVERFPAHVAIVVVDCKNVPAAAAFLILDRGRAEIPWAACRAEAKPLGFNMKLYWEVLSHVIERGCKSFDFGRSTVNAGTYNFKKQWGAQPVQLYWHRWERNPSGEGPSESKLIRFASSVWQRLPLPVANAIGPMISDKLPW